MKKLFITAIALSVLFSNNIFAQATTPENEVLLASNKPMKPDSKGTKGSRGENRNREENRDGGRKGHQGRFTRQEQGIQQVTTFTGKITNKLSNNDFMFDAFELEANGQTYFVKFPKQLGQQIQSMGNNVTVKGVTNSNREGQQDIRFVSIESGNKVVYNTKPARKIESQEEKFINSKGKVSDFRINKRGEVDGLIVNSNTVVNVPKKALTQLYSMIQKGNEISYTGYIKGTKDGEVQLEKYTIVKPTTITVNGIEYLL